MPLKAPHDHRGQGLTTRWESLRPAGEAFFLGYDGLLEACGHVTLDRDRETLNVVVNTGFRRLVQVLMTHQVIPSGLAALYYATSHSGKIEVLFLWGTRTKHIFKFDILTSEADSFLLNKDTRDNYSPLVYNILFLPHRNNNCIGSI